MGESIDIKLFNAKYKINYFLVTYLNCLLLLFSMINNWHKNRKTKNHIHYFYPHVKYIISHEKEFQENMSKILVNVPKKEKIIPIIMNALCKRIIFLGASGMDFS